MMQENTLIGRAKTHLKMIFTLTCTLKNELCSMPSLLAKGTADRDGGGKKKEKY